MTQKLFILQSTLKMNQVLNKRLNPVHVKTSGVARNFVLGGGRVNKLSLGQRAEGTGIWRQ
jgi:hypothetical protein